MADARVAGEGVEVWRRRVRFGDCDPAQIVYYANYFRWVDEACHALFERAGMPMRELDARFGVTLPIVNIESNFMFPVMWDNEIAIESAVSRWGRTSLTVSHRILDAGTRKCVAEVNEVRVCVRTGPAVDGSIEALPIPDEVRAAF